MNNSLVSESLFVFSIVGIKISSLKTSFEIYLNVTFSSEKSLLSLSLFLFSNVRIIIPSQKTLFQIYLNVTLTKKKSFFKTLK
jgi:hypothetical protein